MYKVPPFLVRETSHLVKSRGTRFLFASAQLNSANANVQHDIKESPQLIAEIFKRLLPLKSYEGCKFRHPLIPLPIIDKHVLVEYSSPNIAKPLHAGHLRSTVIGNVLANLYCAAGHNIVRVNYVGDCGTQFAIIGAALSDGDVTKLLEKSDEDSRALVLWLLQKYISQSAKLAKVWGRKRSAHREKERSQLKEMVDLWHQKFETGDELTKQVWEAIRKHSLKDLTAMYHRLGIRFDKIEFESDYIQDAIELGSRLLKDCPPNKGMKFHRADDSDCCFVSLEAKSRRDPEQGRTRVFLKADGSTVYLSRDVSALLNRMGTAKYEFDSSFDTVHYIVENGQTEHLEAIRKIVCALAPEHSEALDAESFHVKFGRVHGMSTRKGSAVLLSDILDEAQARMSAILLAKSTTKIDKSNKEEVASVADRLGVTAVVVNDLKRRRQRDYRFKWARALDFSANGGISLQYTHARLCSIEAQAGFDVDKTKLSVGIEDLLTSRAACRLLNHILQFEGVVDQCIETLQPVHFIHYSLRLARLANRCVEDPRLRVKLQDPVVAQPRLILFKSARNLLASCLNILGQPALSRV